MKDWIRPASGVVTSISYCIQALTAPGDGVVIQPPVYDPFQAVIKGAGRTVLENPLLSTDRRCHMDLDGLEELFRNGARALVLCNPHNPVGRVWTEKELGELLELCLRYHVYVISDEIHCDFGLFGHRYTSVLAFPEGHGICIALTAPGKTFNISGLGISSILAPDPALRDTVGERLRSAWLINPSPLSMAASAAAYRDGSDWHRAQLRYIEDNSLYLRNRLREEAPSIGVTGHEGTFLLWLDFRSFGMTDEALCSELQHQWKLGLNDGAHFGTGGSGFMRLNLGCSRELLETAADRLIAMHRAHFVHA